MSEKVPKGWKSVKLTRNKLAKFCLPVLNEFKSIALNKIAIGRIYP